MKQAFKVVFFYTIFAAIFIFLIDGIVLWAELNEMVHNITEIRLSKRFLFAAGSGIVIYFVAKYYFNQLERVLTNSNEYQVFSEKIISSSSDGIAFIDENGHIVMNNPSLLNFLNLKNNNSGDGFSVDQIDNKKIRTKIYTFLSAQLAGEQFFLDTEPGIWIKLFLERISDSGDKKMVLLRCINISEQVNKEITLEENEQKYLSIFQKVPFGILLVDDAGKVKYNNDMCLELIGGKPQGVSDFLWLNAIHPEDRNSFDAEWVRSMTANSDLKARCRFVVADKSVVWRDVYSTHIKQYDPNVRLVIIQDISEQVILEQKIQENSEELQIKVEKRTYEIEQKSKRLEDSQRALTNLLEDVNEFRDELTSTNDLLASANNELEAFSYSVSHDLRAPLRSINGFSQALMEDYAGNLDETGLDFLNRIRKGAIKMGNLIDDMLILSRIARKELKNDDVNITNIAQEVLNELSETDQLRKNDWNVEEGIVCKGDANLLRILLSNLLGNAWKFTAKAKKGQIIVGKKDQDVIFVKDNGIGFDIRYGDKIFEPFQRIHSTTEYKGTGIGLAIVKRIIQRHQGKIWVESQIDKGTTFYFEIS